MTGFDTKAERFLRQAENKYPVPFEVQHNVVFCEKAFPMTACYEKREERYLFGIKGSVAKDNLCGEKCFFDCCEKLDEQRLGEYKVLFQRLQDELVPAEDPAHDYTLISVILCTAGLEKKLQRKIKHTSDYRQYRGERYGWSALRLCVFDVETETYYYNGMGKGVFECLTRDEIPQERKKLFGLF